MTMNYQKELEKRIEKLTRENKVPKLLLHSCCAPCSSYCLAYLSKYFEITVFYYNPNIYPEIEYQMRAQEQERLIQRMDFIHPVSFLKGSYEPEQFYQMAKGLEDVREGGERCFGCYRMRLEEAAKAARNAQADYFTTTLTISPLKNAGKLNEIGAEIGESLGVEYLYSDFKKKDGYKQSIALSKEYELYRQEYCGCVYSKKIDSGKNRKW